MMSSMRLSDSRRNSMWRKPALRRGDTTTPAKRVSSDSICEADDTSFCVLSGCNWPSIWLISTVSSGLTLSSVSTKKR
ncbi:hypothetical protein D3C83_113690 [compost metagenome]